MFESVVEKLLDVYLAHYVEGIKGNLHLAVWSGNVSLDNLEIKRDIAERLSLPVDLVFGKIGRLMLKIPWAGLGSSPIQIVFESVHILLASKSADKSDDDLLAEIRQAKEYAVSLVENEYRTMAMGNEDQMANSSYLFRLVTKILNNIQIHIKDIHIHYADEQFSIGFKLRSLSIRKCSESHYIYNQYGESYLITHSCELLEASIYCSYADDSGGNGRSPLDIVARDAGKRAQEFDLNALELQGYSHNTVLSPLSMRLHAHINSWDKTVMATLEIGDSAMLTYGGNVKEANRKEADGTEGNGINITLAGQSLLSLIRISSAIKRQRIRKANLLLSQVQHVACDSESLKTVTKSEYIRLQTIALRKGEMTEDERERLQMIFDVAPIRHLAKWRASCKKSLGSTEGARPGGDEGGGGLWNWVKGKTQAFSRSSRGEYEFGGVTLDCEQMQVLQEVMNADDLLQDTPAMGSFSLSFTLGFCSLSIIGDDITGTDLTLTLKNLHSNLFVQSAIDSNELETYNVHSRLRLSQFNCMFERETMVKIDECTALTSRPIASSCQFASLNSPFAESNPQSNNDAILVELAHNVTKAGNVLYLGGLLSPVEVFVIPQKAARLLAFVQHFYNLAQLEGQQYGALSNYVGNATNPPDDPVDDESSAPATTSLTLPGLFAFDLNVSAPIIHLQGDVSTQNPTVEVHLGKLIAKTNSACDIDNISGIIELRETKIICAKGENYIHFLKPVPVKIHFSVIRRASVTLDIIMEELFVQVSPLSVTALLDVPVALASVKRIGGPASEAEGRPGKSSLITVAQAMARSLAHGEQPDASTSSASSLACSLLVRHSGLAMYNSTGEEVFVAELNNVLAKLDHNPAARADKTALYIGLEGASVRNPLSGTLLFVVGQPKPAPGDPTHLQLQLQLQHPPAQDGDAALQNTVRTGVESLDRDDDFFEDAIEEDYKSVEIDIALGDAAKVDARLTEVEACWQYRSVRMVYEAVQEYCEILQRTLPNLGERPPPEQEPLSPPPEPSPLVPPSHPAFDQLVREGIDARSMPSMPDATSGPPFVEIALRVNEAAISFLQDDNSSIGRLAAQHIRSKLCRNHSGDSEIHLDVENGTLLLDGRCLLKAITPEKSNILAIHMRFYAQSQGDAKPPLPFSVCILANMSQVNFIYYQNDLSRLTDYLNDGILNVFISNSYRKVLTAASRRHTLFNLAINNSSIIVPRDTDALHGRLGVRLSLPIRRYDTTALVFSVGALSAKNSYPAPSPRAEGGGEGAGAESTPRCTLSLDISGLSAGLAGPCCETRADKEVRFDVQSGGPPEREARAAGLDSSPILAPVDMKIIYRGGAILNVCMHAERWILELKQELLTAILDVANENLLGNLYLRRVDTEAGGEQAPAAACIFRMNLCLFFQGLDVRLPGLAEIGLDEVVVCLNYFSDERDGPCDGERGFQCDNGYQFGWCAQGLSIDDLRKSRNAHRRLLTCLPAKSPAPPYPSEFRAAPDFFLGAWCRNYAKSTGQDFFNPINRVHGTKFLVTSNGMGHTVEWMLNDPTISVFSVMMADLASFFYNSWSACTMSTHPRPSPPSNPAPTGPAASARRLEVSCHVNGGKFIVYTDVASERRPRIECLSNFALALTLDSGAYTLTRFDVERCSLNRVTYYAGSPLTTCLCDQIDVYLKGSYQAPKNGPTKTDLTAVVPPFNINLYSRDLAILAAALAAVNSDTTPDTRRKNRTHSKTPRGRLKISIKLQDISCTFLDDTRASVVPIMRLSLAGTGGLSATDKNGTGWGASYVCNNCSCKLEYLNAKVGDWEPFIEQAAFEFAFHSSDTPIDPPNRTDCAAPGAKFNSHFMLAALLPVWINVTPHLCQLLLWLGPLLGVEKGEGAEREEGVEKDEGKWGYVAGKHHTHYAYFCLNLTPHCYYALLRRPPAAPGGVRAAGDVGILTLNPSSECFPIDLVAGGGAGSGDDRAHIQLVPAPPFALARNVLERIFGADYPPEYVEPVLRDLMVTRSVEKTVDNFRQRPQGCGVYDPCPPCLGPFPAGVPASVVSLLRNGSVPVNSPLVDAVSISRGAPNQYRLGPPDFYASFLEAVVGGGEKERQREREGEGEKEREGELICHILTPHVSHKVLLICSTVRVFNRCGLPLYLQFLDRRGQPWELPPLDITAPVSVLEQGGDDLDGSYFDVAGTDASKDLRSSKDMRSGTDLLLLDGHFASVPYWVFWGPAHVNLRFRPAADLLGRGWCSSVAGGAPPCVEDRAPGWSKVVDTHVHQGSRWRQCTCEGYRLYFLANIRSSRSAFPGEKDLRDVTIMPAMTVLNALPVGLDLRFSAHGGVTVEPASGGTSGSGSGRRRRVGLAPSAETRRGVCASAAFSLQTRSLMHLYVLTPGESLQLQLRIAGTDSQWTRQIPTAFPAATPVEVRFPDGTAPVELEVARCPVAGLDKFVYLVVTAPLWLVDKTGMGVRPARDGQFYPTVGGITFLRPSKFNELELTVPALGGGPSASVRCQIPVAGGFGLARLCRAQRRGSRSGRGGGATSAEGGALCLNTHKIIFPKFHAHLQSRVVSVIPEFMVTNDSGCDLFVREGEGSPPFRVAYGASVALPWGPVRELVDKEEIELARLQFAALPHGAENISRLRWSSLVYLAEQFAGVTYMGVESGGRRPAVYSLKVIPKAGVKHLCISRPRDKNEGFVLTNKSSYVKCVTIRTFHADGPSPPPPAPPARGEDAAACLTFSAKFGEAIHIGWSHPFVYATRQCQLFLWLDRKTVAPKHPLVLNLSSAAFRFRQMEVTLPEGGPIMITAQRMGSFISISVSTAEGGAGAGAGAAAGGAGCCQLTVTVPQVGVSLVSHQCREELVYAELSNLTGVVSLKGEHQIFELRLSDIQVDMQLEGKNSVVLANRGSQGQKERRYFLQLYVDRPYASLQDIYLRKMFVAVDDLQLDIGAQICESLVGFYYECIQSLGVPKRVRSCAYGQVPVGASCTDGQTLLGRLAFGNKATLLDVENWVLMEARRPQSSIELLFDKPLSISLDYLYIQSCTVFVWCCFELSKLYMLGDLLRIGLRIISASNNLELKGAPVQFPQEFASNVRATAVSFYEQLKDKYMHSAISCLGGLLGYSSLVNIPRMPITLGRNTIELAADAVDNVTAGLGNILSAFTFDTEYINKMQKERSGKAASNIREGFASAGKSIGEGVLSLTNILTKPIEGAQKSGVGGFFKGIGIGIAGSIVKPIDHMRQAVSHVSRGIKADMAKPVGGYKWRCKVRRKPRMLWGEFGKLCEYNAEDADLRQALGAQLSKNIMKSIVTTCNRSERKAVTTLLLFYPNQLLRVSLPDGEMPSVIWKIDYAAIVNTRASNYGVHVETKTKTLQVPAPTVDMIYRVYRQVEDARSQATCFAPISI
ncbi:Vacuolar protein sorting-associated protein 13A [Babesia microti strain RI]|uniref:Vacuolar protein sorting-associated protein 13A n=1 Tax=Babesia microti (strain RI) TaxID=1133968 RepID=A0A1N6LXF6_BABMR|nr:Vacuolar protein sorting-associated protein 13A [Babesia microti strain RI]SIO73542.1 Vacuolar protein sorting-associated protein 13A [Babesia microti strain RI]|eukprot:XP_021337633.1 Vacuolar protein sorting-associated protein 13A [Babesia microti strain RI]